MNEKEISLIKQLMDEKAIEIEKLREELNILNSARLIYLATDRQHHIFEDENEMKNAMLHNFNPFDTFGLKKERKNDA